MLPAKIEELEQRQQELHDLMGQPSFYQQESAEITRTQNELQDVEQELESSYQRWEELED